MFKIQTKNTIASAGLKLFDKEKYEVSSTLSSPDAILIRSSKLSENDIESNVKAIVRAGTGVNNIPLDYCTERGIAVFNTPGANANSVKELVIAGLLLCSRNIHEGMNWVEKQGNSKDLATRVETEKQTFSGNEISRKTLGIIGLGTIGVLVANAAIDLGMQVYGYDPFISVRAAWGLSSRVQRCENLEYLMSSCDYISLHLPLTTDTKMLVNAKTLKRAKKGLRLLNFSRAELVDSNIIALSLNNGTLEKYVTDFPIPELMNIEGVMNIPHLGASTKEAENNCAIMAVEQLKDFLENGNIKNSVNLPDCSLEPSGCLRYIVANRNIPNMLSQILDVFAKENLNVEEMINKNKNNIAYNIIDVSTSRTSETLLEKIKSIDGVLMSRHICF